MKAYNVRYEIDRLGWWVASIPDVPGCYTQGRTIEQSRARIREALGALLGARVAASAELVDDVRLPSSVQSAVAAVERRRIELDRAEKASYTTIREAALKLKGQGLSLRDIGEVLKVSRQRAHQLLED